LSILESCSGVLNRNMQQRGKKVFTLKAFAFH